MIHLLFLSILASTAAHAQEPHFACDLYKALAQENNNKNICFSPFSVQTGIEMAYEGARGTTAQEIAQVLHLQKNNPQRRIEKKKTLDLLNPQDARYTLTCSNNIWIQKGFNVKKKYSLEILQNFYNVQNQSIDFASNPRAAEETINATVSKQTLGHIPTILPAGSLSELTRLVLTNAIYFKGTWETPFDAANTTDAPFYGDEKTTVTVPMMHMPNGKYAYTENKYLQMVELDYASNALSMLILLPKEKNLENLEKELSPENLTAWREQLSRTTVNVYLPRFTFGTAYTLNDTLMDLGIKAAFSPATPLLGANFSGIDGKKDLYISLVAHQATLEVNEEGTVATAATAVVMNMKSVRPQQAIEFRADHSFIFLIQEKTTGTLLFMGRIVNPS
jgi:serpin B